MQRGTRNRRRKANETLKRRSFNKAHRRSMPEISEVERSNAPHSNLREKTAGRHAHRQSKVRWYGNYTERFALCIFQCLTIQKRFPLLFGGVRMTGIRGAFPWSERTIRARKKSSHPPPLTQTRTRTIGDETSKLIPQPCMGRTPSLTTPFQCSDSDRSSAQRGGLPKQRHQIK